MTRSLTSGVKTHLATNEIKPVHLITIGFGTPQNITDCVHDLTSSVSGSSVTYTSNSFLVNISKLSDKNLRDHIQKGIALGYIQSGTELGAFRGALKDAGQKSFWDLSSPAVKTESGLKARAKKINTQAVKLYQSMDDMWKELAFRNEKESYRKILDEKFGEYTITLQI